jgi:hypothetical protein
VPFPAPEGPSMAMTRRPGEVSVPLTDPAV